MQRITIEVQVPDEHELAVRQELYRWINDYVVTKRWDDGVRYVFRTTVPIGQGA
jgi:hypothetical protein